MTRGGKPFHPKAVTALGFSLQFSTLVKAAKHPTGVALTNDPPKRSCPKRAVSIKKKLPFLPFGENGGGQPVWRGEAEPHPMKTLTQQECPLISLATGFDLPRLHDDLYHFSWAEVERVCVLLVWRG
jgi:hypothetical protein